MMHRIDRIVLCGVALAALAGCGGTHAAPAEDAGLRPCSDDDQCLANETCVAGFCQPGSQRDAAPDASPGALQVTPADQVDFGSPVLGSEVVRQVTLANVGGMPVTVNQIDLTENDAVKEFTLDKPTTPFTLDPGASQTLTVHLKTVDGQLDDGQLIINSTDPERPTILLPLTTTAKGAVDLDVCVEKTGPSDCEDPPAFPLGVVSYGMAASRVFHVRASGEGTPVISVQSVTLTSTGTLASAHYQLELHYRHPDPADPTQVIEDATPLQASDFPKLLSTGDSATAPSEIRGVLTFDALVTGDVPTEAVAVQTDSGNVTAPVSGQVTGCPTGWVDLPGYPACGYQCTYQGATDNPDTTANAGDVFADANCDGIDGEIAKAVFVAPPPQGDDATGDGTMDHPYATITKGLQVAGALNRAYVLVAAGTYAETVTLVDGIGLYGGYDSTAPRWTRSNQLDSAIIGAGTSGIDQVAVRASGLTKVTNLDRFSIWSPPAADGFSSYGVFATNVPAHLLAISNCSIHAGSGATGLDGGTGSTGKSGGDGGDGHTGREYTCASWASITCFAACLPGIGCDLEPSTDAWRPAGGTAGQNATCGRPGGTGGAGGRSDETGGNGGPGTGGGVAGSGGPATVNGTPGDPSGSAPAGASGTSGTKGLSFGSAGLAGYVPAGGTAGGAGTAGAGGGGGGGGGGDVPHDTPDVACCGSYGGSGGGGGGGGCSGGGGGGGHGGGGSFGLYLYDASPDITTSVIAVALGGQGGRGGQGGSGGTGGSGGAGGPADPTDITGAGAQGGHGGDGGTGGPGGGGGGGPSIGILSAGSSAPTVDTVTLQHTSVPAYGASGGTSPDASASGQAGLAAKQHSV